jgi:hypothetical protein
MPDYFVIYFDPVQHDYVAAGTQMGASDVAGAIGSAAINNGVSGKYAAFDLADGTVKHVDVAPGATLTDDTF